MYRVNTIGFLGAVDCTSFPPDPSCFGLPPIPAGTIPGVPSPTPSGPAPPIILPTVPPGTLPSGTPSLKTDEAIATEKRNSLLMGGAAGLVVGGLLGFLLAKR